jgi:hypothetical protein
VSSIRLNSEIKEYFKIRNINLREIIEQKYYEMKKNEIPELLKEKEKLQQRVLQIDEIVIQFENENNEKYVNQVENEIKNTLKMATFPEYYIGKTIAGKKITRKIYNKYVKE